MMAETSKMSVRRQTMAVLTLFLLLNVVLAVLALATAFGGRQLTPLLPEDSGAAVQVGAVLLGAAFAWFLGRWLYLQMLYADFRPDESATGAMAITLYLLLLFAGAVFGGAVLWEWLVLLVLVMVLISLLGLRKVIGTGPAVLIIVVCLTAGAILYFYLIA